MISSSISMLPAWRTVIRVTNINNWSNITILQKRAHLTKYTGSVAEKLCL